MTREELMIGVLQRRNRRQPWNSREVAQALGIAHQSLLGKVKKLTCDEEFVNENFIFRPYTGPDTTNQVFCDIFTPGVMLLLLKGQSDKFRLDMIAKLIALL